MSTKSANVSFIIPLSLLPHLNWPCSCRSVPEPSVDVILPFLGCCWVFFNSPPLSLSPLSSPFTPKAARFRPLVPPTSFYSVFQFSLPIPPSIHLSLPLCRSFSPGPCGQLDGFVFDTCVGRRQRTRTYTHTHKCTHSSSFY